MKREQSFGCKKCGGVVQLQTAIASNRVESRATSGGELREKSNRIVLSCKNKNKFKSTCNNEVATLEWSTR